MSPIYAITGETIDLRLAALEICQEIAAGESPLAEIFRRRADFRNLRYQAETEFGISAARLSFLPEDIDEGRTFILRRRNQPNTPEFSLLRIVRVGAASAARDSQMVEARDLITGQQIQVMLWNRPHPDVAIVMDSPDYFENRIRRLSAVQLGYRLQAVWRAEFDRRQAQGLALNSLQPVEFGLGRLNKGNVPGRWRDIGFIEQLGADYRFQLLPREGGGSVVYRVDGQEETGYFRPILDGNQDVVRRTLAASRLNSRMGLTTVPLARALSWQGPALPFCQCQGVFSAAANGGTTNFQQSALAMRAQTDGFIDAWSFEFLIGNADVSDSNIATSEALSIEVFDHGHAFHLGVIALSVRRDSPQNGMEQDFRDLPPRYTAKFVRALLALDREALDQTLAKLLFPEEIEAILLRRSLMLADIARRFPELL